MLCLVGLIGLIVTVGVYGWFDGWVGSGVFDCFEVLFVGFIVVCGNLCWCWLVYLR